MCQGTNRGAERARESEVRQLQLAVAADEEILGLEIPARARHHMRLKKGQRAGSRQGGREGRRAKHTRKGRKPLFTREPLFARDALVRYP